MNHLAGDLHGHNHGVRDVSGTTNNLEDVIQTQTQMGGDLHQPEVITTETRNPIVKCAFCETHSIVFALNS